MPHEDRAGGRLMVEDHAPVADPQAVMLAAGEAANVEGAILGDEAFECDEDASADRWIESPQFLLGAAREAQRAGIAHPAGWPNSRLISSKETVWPAAMSASLSASAACSSGVSGSSSSGRESSQRVNAPAPREAMKSSVASASRSVNSSTR